MKDLRIITVPWNNENTLARCLSSLPDACRGLSWEVVVVDNASRDKSAEIAQEAISDHGQVIVNRENRGFAKACNQGLVDLSARYVLLLNPDTVCPPGSLEKLVKYAEGHPKAGIIGPKLVNDDGTTQTSIRRFPGVWDQAGVLLKLHNFFPRLFRHYFAGDLDLEKEQDVDQVMGSCFLIRREVIDQLGGLDERYFIWFEEVDYCRMARERGWTIRYVPSVSVTHHGGESFRQTRAMKKQGMFHNSLFSYFQKWHPGWRATFLRALGPFSLGLAWMFSILGLSARGSRRVLHLRPSLRITPWVFVVIIVEIVSALTIFHNAANGIATIIAGLMIAWLAWKRPTFALAAITLELIIGSQGHLLQFWGWPGIVSLRMAMFVGFGIGYLASRVGARFIAPRTSRRGAMNRAPTQVWNLVSPWIGWMLLGLVVIWGAARGLMIGNGPVWPDANAWIFLLLIIPVMDVARRQGKRLAEDVLPVLVVGPIWMVLKALGIEYLFTHGLAVVDPPSAIYLWIRRTGVGEVTPVSGGLHRVFFQSFIFMLPVLFFALSHYFATHEKGLKGRIALLSARGAASAVQIWDILLSASFIALVLSLSRSLWIGAVGGVIVLAVLHLIRRNGVRVLRTAFRCLIIGAEAIALIAVFVAFPLPQPDVSGWGDLITSRVSPSEPAAASRWELLPAMWERITSAPILGSGLGAELTYRSSDPRVLKNDPAGQYTTYAFEWGWLDLWLKFGILGPLVMLFLLYRIGTRLVRANAPDWMRYAGVASLAGLAAVHFFTPYLNHPLGLGYLMMLEGWSLLHKTQ